MVFDIEKAQQERIERKEKRGAEFEFEVLLFTPERRDFSVKVKISENDPQRAIKIALDAEKIKGYHQAKAILLPFKKS